MGDTSEEGFNAKVGFQTRGHIKVSGVHFGKAFFSTHHASSSRLPVEVALREKLDPMHIDTEQALIQSILG